MGDVCPKLRQGPVRDVRIKIADPVKRQKIDPAVFRFVNAAHIAVHGHTGEFAFVPVEKAGFLIIGRFADFPGGSGNPGISVATSRNRPYPEAVFLPEQRTEAGVFYDGIPLLVKPVETVFGDKSHIIEGLLGVVVAVCRKPVSHGELPVRGYFRKAGLVSRYFQLNNAVSARTQPDISVAVFIYGENGVFVGEDSGKRKGIVAVGGSCPKPVPQRIEIKKRC